MNAKVEKKQNNVVTITFEVDKDAFAEGLTFSFNKNKGQFSLPGFRKGKAPRALIEKQYGIEMFYDDAINHVLPPAYEAALDELALDVVSKPEIDILSCDKETGVTFTADITVKPDVTLGEYRGVTFEEPQVVVEQDEINAKLDADLEKNARLISVTERGIANGDIATINFEGFIDDVPFEGGKGENHELTIGSHSFIDTFEEQLIGHNVGDDVLVNVTFPAEYGHEALAGKPAQFKVQILNIQVKELPALDDDFAQDVSEFDTLEEYKADIQAKLLTEKTEKAEKQKEEDIMKTVTENAAVDIPDVMVDNQVEQMVADFTNRLRMQGLTFEMYSQYTGQDVDSLKDMYKEQAAITVRSRLVLEAIAKTENISVSDEEVDAEIEKIAKGYNLELDKMKTILREQDIKGIQEDLKVAKALQLVVSNAVKA